MTAMPRELARRRPAEVTVQQQPEVIEGEIRPTHSAFARKENTALKVIAFLLLAFGMAGYVLASLQTL